MRGILAPLLSKFQRRTAVDMPARSDASDQPTDDEVRIVVRSLATLLDRAMQLGQFEHADRIARSVARLAPRAPSLSERIARLRLAQGQAETALAVIDSCRVQTSSLRLLRAVCLMRIGRRDEAHSDLHQWSSRATAPLDARLMLALLEWESGDLHAAMLALMRNLRHLEDPSSLIMLVLLAIAEDRPDAAERWANRLRDVSAFGAGPAYVDLLCCSLGLPRPVESRTPSDEQIGSLAIELIAAEDAIPALVEAQRLRFEPRVAQLLAAAIERSFDELIRPARGSEALAKLALLRGERENAVNWIQVGLLHDPESPVLHDMAEQIDRREGHRSDVLATIGAARETERDQRGRAA